MKNLNFNDEQKMLADFSNSKSEKLFLPLSEEVKNLDSDTGFDIESHWGCLFGSGYVLVYPSQGTNTLV